MRITPFGYRDAAYEDGHSGIISCLLCKHSQRPKVRLVCGLTGAVVGKHKTCSYAVRAAIGGVNEKS